MPAPSYLSARQAALILGLTCDDRWVYGTFADLAYLCSVLRDDYGRYEYSVTGIYLNADARAYQLALRS